MLNINNQVEINKETLAHCQINLEDHKRILTNQSEITTRVLKQLDRFKNELRTDIQRSQEETNAVVASIAQECTDKCQQIQTTVAEDWKKTVTTLTDMKTELLGLMGADSSELKTYVLHFTNRASAHRETLQEKYDEKLDKIKDICSQYFSKYEKQLAQQQDIVKQLEKRQDDWINTLIKPQELNQARLFTLDTLVKEAEISRSENNQFFKDILKKLIFAIEQHQGALVSKFQPETVNSPT